MTGAARIDWRIDERRRMARNARRWSDEKLDREIAFAEGFAPALDDTQADWLDVVRAERDRRKYARKEDAE